MIKIKEAVIVEGKYDKIKLMENPEVSEVTYESKDEAFLNLQDSLAENKGIIIMTDSDSAGFKIRSFIQNITKSENIKNVFMPDIYGKEKRKTEASKEGKLGVEGIKKEIILDALEKAGVFCDESQRNNVVEITHTDFFEDNVSGGENSSLIRKALAKELDLPERISSSSLLKLINSYMTYDEYKNAVQKAKDRINNMSEM